MRNEINELFSHNTWESIKKSAIPKEKKKEDFTSHHEVLPDILAFKIKQFHSGLLRKIEARFFVCGDQQIDVDPFETHAPVVSWLSICMWTITTLQRGWITKQTDFSLTFIQSPMQHNVHITLPALFGDINCVPGCELCVYLKKSPCGLHKATKFWADWLAKGLSVAGSKFSDNDQASFVDLAWFWCFGFNLFLVSLAERFHKLKSPIALSFRLSFDCLLRGR